MPDSLFDNTPNEVPCENCGDIMLRREIRCTTCAFPQHGSDEAKKFFLNRQQLLEERIHGALKQVKIGRYVLFGLGIFATIIGLVLLLADSPATELFYLGIGAFFLGLVYLGLAFYSRENARLALLFAVIVMAFNILANILELINEGSGGGFIFSVLFIILLARGYQGTRELEEANEDEQLFLEKELAKP